MFGPQRVWFMNLLQDNIFFKEKKVKILIKGEGISVEEDHLAQFIETLGPIPKKFIDIGRNSKQYFKKYKLKNINGKYIHQF